MNILIPGGRGFLGNALAHSLASEGHKVFILTRGKPRHPNHYQWDGVTTRGWGYLVNEMDAIVNLSGLSTSHWPWTNSRKKQFIDSRVLPGRAFVSAIAAAARRPRIYLQASGINYYGLDGDAIADEGTLPAHDFLAQLAVQWEAATEPLDELGVRRVILRSAVVLDLKNGLFPLLTLPVRLFFGGKFGKGSQSLPWIHIADYMNAVRFLLVNESAQGAFNLIAPETTSNADFMQEICRTLQRPYWFHVPEFLLRLILGEMSILLVKGRYSRPRRLLDMGFKFQFDTLRPALQNLLAG